MIYPLYMKRTFHPVGQGAFYTETFTNNESKINIVYDCGTETRIVNQNKVVQNAFDKDAIIDALFISHFHSDHTSLIGVLKSNFTIKRVIMPYLNDEEKLYILSSFKRNANKDSIQILLTPDTYFNEGTDIIYVTPADLDNANNPQLNEEPSSVLLSSIKNKERVRSSVGYSVSGLVEWKFVPYCNPIDSSIISGFKSEVEKKFKKSCEELIKNQDLITTKKNRATLRELYKQQISSDINHTSMLLYSGPVRSCKRNFSMIIKDFELIAFYQRVGCIFTGDSNIAQILFQSAFGGWETDISGTLQIPHHGSNKNNDERKIKNGMFCPISHGIKNRHKHPNKSVLHEILKKRGIPIMVTEDLKTAFSQYIR